jgi:hypothetical protein
MYPAKPGLIIGFHGCDQSIRDLVASGQTVLNPSRNGYDWLGHGIYFWENNYERALEFANNPPGKRKIQNPAVLGAVIDLQNCLDLLDKKYLNLVKKSYVELISHFKDHDMTAPVNRTINNSKDLLIRELDCAVIENLHETRMEENRKPFDSVRGVFVEGQELYPGAGFNDKNHIQICIRNPNCIKGLFVPRKELSSEEIFNHQLISLPPGKSA